MERALFLPTMTAFITSSVVSAVRNRYQMGCLGAGADDVPEELDLLVPLLSPESLM